MIVLKGLHHNKIPKKRSVLTIGVFDGVHVGHKRIIAEVVRRARRMRMKSVVVTFNPHPLKVLRPGHKVPSLVSLDHRIRIIEECGADILAVLKFSGPLSDFSPERFVKNILIDKLGMKELYVGENFYFGKGAKAGPAALKRLAAKFGHKIEIIKPVKIGRRVVSSSLIRRLITDGDLDGASRFLGRPVSVLGSVVSGAKLARALGCPTANINPHHEVIPPSGVYAVEVYLDKMCLKGVLNIGVRPTFYSPRDSEPTIEVHIFDFKKSIYRKEIEIFFIDKIREELKFKSREELVAQIKEDEKSARAILKRKTLCAPRP